MHLCKLLNVKDCEIGFKTNRQLLGEIRQELEKVHPNNFFVLHSIGSVNQTQIELPIYRIDLEYDIVKNAHLNHRWTTKYVIMPSQDEDALGEFYDYWIDMACNDFISSHQYRIRNINILSEKYICNAVLKFA